MSVFLDGTLAMKGHKKGFMSYMYIKKKNKSILVVHCFFHRENLAAKENQENLVQVFKEVVAVVNHIKYCLLCNPLFQALCEEL